MSPLIQKTAIVSISSIIFHLTVLPTPTNIMMYSLAPGMETHRIYKCSMQMSYVPKGKGTLTWGWLVSIVRAQATQKQDFCKIWSNTQ